MKIISFLDYLSIITGTIRIIILSHQSVSILIQSLLNVIVNEGWKKSTKNTNQIQKLIDQNRHYQRTSNWSFFALLCTRKFVPKIRTPKIRTRNPYQKFISKTRTENLCMRTYHPCARKSKFCESRDFTKQS